MSLRIGNKVGVGYSKGAPISFSSFWTTLISALINLASPKNIVMTFSKANTSLTASDFMVSGNTVNSILRDATNKILTLVCANNLVGGETVTLNKGTGLTAMAKYILPSPATDLVQWNSIDSIATTGAALNATTGGMTFLNKFKGERVTGYRNISQVDFYNIALTNVAAIKFYVWRLNGSSTYDKVYEEDITAKVTAGAGIKNVTLATSIAVIEGDYIGMTYQSSSVNTQCNYLAAAAANSVRYNALVSAPTDPYAFDSQTGIAYKAAYQVKGAAPLVVGIGDSIMDSYPLHTSMVDTGRTEFDVVKSWLYKLYARDSRFIYQNCGIGAETTTLIQARFNRDVVLKKPKFAVINGGVNDLAAGIAEGNKTTFLTKWTAILDACVTNSIIPIVWKIMPWNAGTTDQMNARDDWNAALVTLFNTYSIPGKIIIDWDNDLGVFREGGPAGNKWDINPTYINGTVHYSEPGQAKIAEVMLREAGEIFDL